MLRPHALLASHASECTLTISFLVKFDLQYRTPAGPPLLDLLNAQAGSNIAQGAGANAGSSHVALLLHVLHVVLNARHGPDVCMWVGIVNCDLYLQVGPGVSFEC